ncbi:MAG: hypothetical protein ABSH30_14630 [Acidimicrobiales bacterium]|jgi:hypothetical protein
MVERELSFPSESRLVRCEAKGAAISWPIPLDNLLDHLVELCDDYGQPTNRKELAAAIVFDAPRDGAALAERLLAYRRATIAELAPEGSAGENVIPFHVRRPGPRPKRGNGG